MAPPPTNTSPEAWLGEALRADDAQSRAKYATRGLSCHRLEDDTQGLLLRQLYLAHLERGCLADARAVAQQMVDLGTLGDIALRDLAVACLALGATREARHALRLAGRAAPVQRRAVHLSSLGALLYLEAEYELAATTLKRALRWADGRSVVYTAQLALVQYHLAEQSAAELKDVLLSLAPLKGLFPTFLQAEAFGVLGEHQEARAARLAFVDAFKVATPVQRAGLAAEYRKVRGDLAS